MKVKIMNSKLIITLLVFLSGAVILSGCGKSDGETETKETKKDEKLQIVKVMDVTTSSFTENLKVVGVVKPFASAKISSEEGGLITSLNKDKGSYVRRGEIV